MAELQTIIPKVDDKKIKALLEKLWNCYFYEADGWGASNEKAFDYANKRILVDCRQIGISE